MAEPRYSIREMGASQQSKSPCLWNSGPQPRAYLSVCFSPDGESLLAVTLEHLDQWSWSNGKLMARYPIAGQVVAFRTRNNKLECLLVVDGGLYRVPLDTGKRSAIARWDPNGFCGAAFSPDLKLALVGFSADRVEAWETETGILRWSVRTKAGSPDLFTWVDNDHVALLVADGEIAVVQQNDGAVVRTITADPMVSSLAVLKDRTWVVGGRMSATYDLGKDGNGPTTQLSSHTDRTWQILPTRDGEKLIAITQRYTIEQWDGGDNKPSKVFIGHSLPINGVALHPRRNVVATVSDDATLRVWDLDSAGNGHLARGDIGAVQGIAAVRGSTWVLSGSSLGTLQCWYAQNGALVDSLATTNNVWSVASGLHGQVFTTHETGRVSSWVVSTPGVAVPIAKRKKPAAPTWIHRGTVWTKQVTKRAALAVSPDGKLLFVGGSKFRVLAISIDTGDLIQEYAAAKSPTNCLAVSADNTLLVAGADSGVLIGWDVTTGVQQWECRPNMCPTRSVLMLDDGTMVFTPCDGSVYLFDPAKQSVLWTAQTHAGTSAALCSLDGSDRFVSAGTDGSIALWDKSSPTPLSTLQTEESLLSITACSATSFAVGTKLGQVRFYEVVDTKVRDEK